MNKELKYLVLTFVLSSLIIGLFYSDVIFNLNNVVFSGGGDGIKNYYTYMFHAKYDPSFFEFKGMNYPFYENVVYTDAHPLLSYLIGKLGLVNYGVGILNFLMLIAYPISNIFIFKILRHYKVDILWSILAGICITFMAPQVFRMTGHFSLSYVFAVPLMWFILIKAKQNLSFKWHSIASIYLIIFFFTHPYLGLILTIFALAFWGVNWLVQPKSKTSFKLLIVQLGFYVIFPILFFQVAVFLSDTHSGRLSNPSGFFFYYATLKSLLVAHHGPILHIKPWFGLNSGNWESWSYLGLGTLLYFITILVFVIKHRATIHFKKIVKSPLGIGFIASFLVLLFAMCIPFRWDLFKWIANSLGPLKQFRVLGRFTWIFFYVFTISCVILLYKIKQQSNRKTVINGIFIIGIVFYILELYPTHKSVNKTISATKNPFKQENLSADLSELIDKVKKENYDAIIFLPFTHMSSESVFILGSENSSFQALMLSYHTHLPLLNTMSSRTSVNEAVDMINLFSPEFIYKDLADKIGKDKKILLVKNNDGLDINERRMAWKSTKIYQNESLTAYNFSFKDWNSSKYYNAVIEKANLAKVNLGEGWFSDTTTWFYYDSFDYQIEKNAMFGKGAFAQQKIGWNKLIELNTTQLNDGKYIASFWYNINIGKPDVLAVAEKVTSDTTIWVDKFMVRETNLVLNNTWAYVELEFDFTEGETINILLTSGKSDEWMVVDELLIRKQNGADLFRNNLKLNKNPSIKSAVQTYLDYNNYWLKNNSFTKKP